MPQPDTKPQPVKACLVPHAGYVFSGHVAGAVFSRVALPQKIVILGVRHFPRGESLAINTSGAWRTPFGDAPIDEVLAATLKKECPILREDRVAVGEALARVLVANPGVLLLTTSDLNHYENDATTRLKDKKAIDQILALNSRGLYDVCRNEDISMCGLGPAVAMLIALRTLAAKHAELVRYATSADVSGDTNNVVGYAGLIFF